MGGDRVNTNSGQMFDETSENTDDLFCPYATLGVAAHAGPDEVTRARNALLKEHREALGTNPTVEQTEKLRRIIEAHDILANPATRRAYDLGRRARDAVNIDITGNSATLSPAWSDMFGSTATPAHWKRPENKDRDSDNILTRIFGI